MSTLERKTLIIGASENTERYSYKALQMLQNHGYEVEALAQRPGRVEDIVFQVGFPSLQDIDTVTLYINPQRLQDYEAYIISLQPRRVIFNPGTENGALMKKFEKAGILCEEACTLVLLQTGQYQ
jgi:uncharacterized protein